MFSGHVISHSSRIECIKVVMRLRYILLLLYFIISYRYFQLFLSVADGGCNLIV